MTFSLKWLLIAIALIALSLVVLLNATDLWVMVSRNVVRLTVLIAIVGAAWTIGKQRAFWSGYAVFVVVYINSGFGFLWITESLTDRVLAYIHPQIASLVTETFSPPIPSFPVVWSQTSNPDGSVAITFFRPHRHHFLMVGDAVFSLFIGLLGGLIATAFYRRCHDRTSAEK